MPSATDLRVPAVEPPMLPGVGGPPSLPTIGHPEGVGRPLLASGELASAHVALGVLPAMDDVRPALPSSAATSASLAPTLPDAPADGSSVGPHPPTTSAQEPAEEIAAMPAMYEPTESTPASPLAREEMSGPTLFPHDPAPEPDVATDVDEPMLAAVEPMLVPDEPVVAGEPVAQPVPAAVEPVAVEETPVVVDEPGAPVDAITEPIPVVTVAEVQPIVVPAADVPAADVPAADVPAADVPTADVPASDVPTADVPTAGAPTVDVPAADVPTTDATVPTPPAPHEPALAPAEAAPAEVPAMGVPVLPSFSPTPTAVAEPVDAPPNERSQGGITSATWMHDPNAVPPMPGGPGRPTRSGSSPIRSFLLTVVASLLAVAAGAGAHLGYDWYQDTEEVAAPVVTANGDLAGWKHVDPPAIRYTDTATTIVTDSGVRELTAHRDLVSGSRIVSVAETNFVGETTSVDVELRDTQAFVRTAPDTPWVPTSAEEASAIIGDEGFTEVFTVSDLFPAESLAFATVLESAEDELPLAPIRRQVAGIAAPPIDNSPGGEPDAGTAGETLAGEPAPVTGEGTAPVFAAGVSPTTVWHYRVVIDTDAFRAAEAAAFEAWERQLGRAAGSQFDVWIDAEGLVRRLVIDDDGVQVTQTLIGGAPTSALLGPPPPFGSPPTDGVPQTDGVPLDPSTGQLAPEEVGS